jgi:transposase
MAGKGSKIMAIVDGNGLPLGLYIADARPHESRYAEATLRSIKVPQPRGRPRTRPKELIADKAYDSRALRESLRKRGIKPTIPVVIRRISHKPKRGRPLRTGPNFKQRWKVERTFAWMDNHRRLVVRYDRSVEHYQSFCFLAIIMWCTKRILK